MNLLYVCVSVCGVKVEIFGFIILRILFNIARSILAILNKSWRQHSTKQQLYDHLPPITKTIQVTRTRHAGHCWRSRDELISNVLLWTPLHGWTKAGRPPQTYIQQLSKDMGCSPGDLPETMNDREGWWERVRDIHVDGMTRWWWFLELYHSQYILEGKRKCIL